MIAGAGVMGSAAALEVARRGKRVLLLDRFNEGHSRGSSHGPTRIFRLSYPDPTYVALGIEALDDWRRLERDSRTKLLDMTGSIDHGPGAPACEAAMTSLGVAVEHLDAGAASSRFGVTLPHGTDALFHADAGVISAAETARTQARLASFAGAEVRWNAPLTAIEAGDHVTVTAGGATIEASVLVIASGPWAEPVAAMASIEVPVFVTCEQVTYFSGVPESFPVIIEWTDQARYLVPARAGALGARVGVHHAGRVVDPDDGPFESDPAIEDAAADWVREVAGPQASAISTETCLYTNAPDEAFILERRGSVIVMSPCSGHGFKFAPRLGRAVADIIDGVQPSLPGDLGAWWRAAG